MAATTDQKARLFDLMINVGELVRDGNRNPTNVAEVLQIIKNEQNFAALLLAKRDGALAPKPSKLPLLQFVGIVDVLPTERFITNQKFVVNIRWKAPVNISRLGDNFRTWFLGKTEEAMGMATLRYANLLRSARDEEILTELGMGFEETMLAGIFVLMSRQPNGEKGVLLTNRWNVFYARDVNGVLRVVGVCWYGDGWYVNAYSVDSPGGWNNGNHVFSRNSLVPVAA